MNLRLKLILGITICIAITSCGNKGNDKMMQLNTKPLPQGSILVADSIIYDVVIRALDTTDTWDSERLKTFKQDVYIDNIFDQLYKGKLTACDFYTGNKLSVKDIKDIESSEGYSRSKVSKVQFNEQWVIDSLGVLNKRINCMTLGIESYSHQGTFTGHKALFRVYPNSSAR